MIQKHNYHFDKKLKENRRGYLVVSVADVYKRYSKDDKLVNEPLEYALFREVLEFMFSRIWFYIITELWIFRPPHNFGEFYIAEHIGSKGFFKNWSMTRKKGKLIEDYNLHTDGRSFYIKWNKRLSRVTNQSGYRFTPYRGDGEELIGRRGLAAHIKDCSNDPLKKDYRAHII